MVILFNNGILVYYNDYVGVLDRVKVVGDEEDGVIFEGIFKVDIYLLFGYVI